MSTALEDIKKERERFVAFAFAAAEIFFELDPEGKILFDGGAVERIGTGKQASHMGDSIYDLIDPDDRDIFRALTQHLSHKGRIGPIPIRFKSDNNRSLALRIFALGMPGANARTFLALRSAPLGAGSNSESGNEETGLLSQAAFMKLAASTMAENPPSSNLYMTAIEVKGLDAAKKKLSPDQVRSLLGQIAGHLKTLSIDGQSASQISDTHFAFLHRTKADGNHLSDSIKTLDGGVSLKPSYSTLTSDTAGVSEDQILRTLTYILTKFCKNPSDVNFDSLSEAYENMAVETQSRISLMRSTIDTGNFKMAFQPVVSFQTGDPHHNEVLSRFNEALEGQTPLEIIKFAEEVGIIEEFDIALCRKAVDYIRKMKKLGNPLTLSLNISGRTLDSGRFVDPLVKALKEAKDVAHSILLELTETTALQDIEKVSGILKDLKSFGYKICLDDFGAGAAGYQYLRSFNIDYVKIDGSYIQDMDKKNYKPTFLMSIIHLCADLGIKTIAEHVENRFQADFLKSLGVDYGQGFYFGRPDFTPRTQ